MSKLAAGAREGRVEATLDHGTDSLPAQNSLSSGRCGPKEAVTEVLCF